MSLDFLRWTRRKRCSSSAERRSLHQMGRVREDDSTSSTKPGGQKVNKVATAVQLRFDVGNSPSLPDDVRERLVRLASRRITQDRALIIRAECFRTRDRNRQDAIGRLIELIRKAAEEPKPRRKTRPILAPKTRRLEAKRRGAETKRTRRSVPPAEDRARAATEEAKKPPSSLRCRIPPRSDSPL